MGKQLSPTKRGQILGMMRAGMSSRKACEVFKVNRSVGDLIWKKYTASGDIARKAGSGRPKKTTRREDRRIIRAVLANREITADQIREDLGLQHLSDATIYRRIVKLTGMKSYWKLLKPFMNDKQRKRRIKWCKAHRDWTKEQWH